MEKKSNAGYSEHIELNIDIEGVTGNASYSVNAEVVKEWVSKDGGSMYLWGAPVVEFVHDGSRVTHSRVGAIVRLSYDESTVCMGVALKPLVDSVLATKNVVVEDAVGMMFLLDKNSVSALLTGIVEDITEAFTKETQKIRIPEWEEMLADLPNIILTDIIDLNTADEDALKAASTATLHPDISGSELHVYSKDFQLTRVSSVLSWMSKSETSELDIRYMRNGCVFVKGKSGQMWYLGSVEGNTFDNVPVHSVSGKPTYFKLKVAWSDLGMTPTLIHKLNEEHLKVVEGSTKFGDHFSTENDAVKFTTAYLDDLFSNTA